MSDSILLTNKTYLGDCLNVMAEIPNKAIDMILTDLPYKKTALKWDKIIPFDTLWKQYERIIKPNGAIVLFGCEPFSSLLRCSNLKLYKYDWVWDKCNTTNFTNAKKMPLRKHENIMVFYKEQPKYNPQFEIISESDPRYRKNGRGSKAKKYSNTVYGNITELRRSETGKRYPNSILKFNNSNGYGLGKMHPTQKPVPLYEFLIKTYTNEGDLVLDSCAGSGTLGEACCNLNRRYIMIEKNKTYFEQIQIREVKFKPTIPI